MIRATAEGLQGLLREWYERARLSDAQVGAIRWLAAQPSAPAKMTCAAKRFAAEAVGRIVDHAMRGLGR